MYKATFLFCLFLFGCNAGEHQRAKTVTVTEQVSAPQPVSKNVEEVYAMITNVSGTDSSGFIDADYIQFLSGEEAIAAARNEGEADMFIEDNGDTTYAVPNDHYILNKSKKIRRLSLSGKVAFELVINNDRNPPVLRNDFETFRKIHHDNLFILALQDGRVAKITEVFIP